jgi:hypothetical protein
MVYRTSKWVVDLSMANWQCHDQRVFLRKPTVSHGKIHPFCHGNTMEIPWKFHGKPTVSSI